METTELSKPLFSKIEELNPTSRGFNLKVKVLEKKKVVERVRIDGKKLSIYEVLVGDDTGSVIVTARNEQADKFEQNDSLILRNARVDMFKGFIRLSIDKWGKIETLATPHAFEVLLQEDKNFSEIEYELVPVDVE